MYYQIQKNAKNCLSKKIKFIPKANKYYKKYVTHLGVAILN